MSSLPTYSRYIYKIVKVTAIWLGYSTGSLGGLPGDPVLFEMTKNVKWKGLNELVKKAEALEENQIPILELMSDDFVQRHTRFQTFQQMVDTSGIEQTEKIAGPVFSQFVASNSSFDGWEAMLQAAIVEWMRRKLGF